MTGDLAGGVAFAEEHAGSAVAVALLAAYRAELALRFPGGFEPPPGWAAPAEQLVRPRGAFLVVRDAGDPAGCGAVRVLEPGVAEIKHMWLAPALRGRGLGRRLLGALEAIGRELGCTAVRLDTSPHLPEALALYRAVGYREIPRYNDNPLCAIWLGRALV